MKVSPIQGFRNAPLLAHIIKGEGYVFAHLSLFAFVCNVSKITNTPLNCFETFRKESIGSASTTY